MINRTVIAIKSERPTTDRRRRVRIAFPLPVGSGAGGLAQSSFVELPSNCGPIGARFSWPDRGIFFHASGDEIRAQRGDHQLGKRVRPASLLEASNDPAHRLRVPVSSTPRLMPPFLEGLRNLPQASTPPIEPADKGQPCLLLLVGDQLAVRGSKAKRGGPECESTPPGLLPPRRATSTPNTASPSACSVRSRAPLDPGQRRGLTRSRLRALDSAQRSGPFLLMSTVSTDMGDATNRSGVGSRGANGPRRRSRLPSWLLP
jgi:hypothetical protein